MEARSQDLEEDAKECLASCKSTAEDCRTCKHELSMQVKMISRGLSELRAKAEGKNSAGLKQPSANAQQHALKQQICTLKEDLDLEILQLGEDSVSLGNELSGLFPSVLARTCFVDENHEQRLESEFSSLQAFACSQEEDSKASTYTAASHLGYNTGKDVAELKALILRHPLASERAKSSILEVHTALQEIFLERLLTWRVEHEASGLGIGTGGHLYYSTNEWIP